MFLEESPDQRELRAELRRYYEDLLTDELRAGLGRGRRRRRGLARRRTPDRQGRLARHRVADRVRGAGSSGHRPVHLLRRDAARGRAVPLRHRQHRRADHHALRHRRAEVVLPAQHPVGRHQLRHRLHRARGRYGPGLVAHAGHARRRRVRHQRRQDLHVGCRQRGLRLAGRAHRTRTSPSTRASPSCACRRRRPDSSGPSSTRWAG